MIFSFHLKVEMSDIFLVSKDITVKYSYFFGVQRILFGEGLFFLTPVHHILWFALNKIKKIKKTF